MSKDFPTNLPRIGIYSIACLVDGRVYIGQSRRLRERWRNHLSRLQRGKGPPRLQKAWDLYGEKSFLFEVLEVVSNPDLLQGREQFHIDRLETCGVKGFNTLPIAGSFKSYTPDQEARAKIGAASKKRWVDPDFRSRMTEAQAKAIHPKREPLTSVVKQKIRLKLTGVALSPERRKNMSLAKAGKAPVAAIAAWTGSTQTEETKRKIGKANKGRKWSEDQKAKIRGRKVSPSHLQAMSKARKGVPWTPARIEAEKLRKERRQGVSP